jgi:hypothetical protein
LLRHQHPCRLGEIGPRDLPPQSDHTTLMRGAPAPA